MMSRAIIGLLPASGRANRLGGLPKFSLPMSDQLSLLEYHVLLMNDVCEEIRISTCKEWIPILDNMNLLNSVVVEYRPTTMIDSVHYLSQLGGDNFIVGMPDTYYLGYQENPYVSLIETDSDLALGLWTFEEKLRGKVGQVRKEFSGLVMEVVDKETACEFLDIWGTFKFNRGYNLDLSNENFSCQFQQWIKNGEHLQSCFTKGRYMDLGTFEGIKDFYCHL